MTLSLVVVSLLYVVNKVVSFSFQNAVSTAEGWALSWGARFGHSKTVQLAFGSRMNNIYQDSPLYIERQAIKLHGSNPQTPGNHSEQHSPMVFLHCSSFIEGVAEDRVALIVQRPGTYRGTWSSNCTCPTLDHAWSMLPQYGTLG